MNCMDQCVQSFSISICCCASRHVVWRHVTWCDIMLRNQDVSVTLFGQLIRLCFSQVYPVICALYCLMRKQLSTCDVTSLFMTLCFVSKMLVWRRVINNSTLLVMIHVNQQLRIIWWCTKAWLGQGLGMVGRVGVSLGHRARWGIVGAWLGLGAWLWVRSQTRFRHGEGNLGAWLRYRKCLGQALGMVGAWLEHGRLLGTNLFDTHNA